MNAFLHWYQHLPEKVSPTLLALGSVEVRWYSLSYVLAMATIWLLGRYRISKNEARFPLSPKDLEVLLLYIFVGIVVGGRFGYIFFYDLGGYMNKPLQIILPFRFEGGFQFTGISGMSYHGGLLGVVGALLIFAKRRKIGFFDLTDFVLPCGILGIFWGRLGNFTNGELYGRITEVPWGMYFYNPKAININSFGEKEQALYEVLRHPSQLYEAFFEGLLLFVVFWVLRNKPFLKHRVGILYFIGYGASRFVIEFFREPDKQFLDPGEKVGTVIWFLSMGQILCLMMLVAAGIAIYVQRSEKKRKNIALKEE